MSKTDNLHDFLVDIADAVREKKGTTEPINAQDLSEEIRGIESGGGGFNATVEIKDPLTCSPKSFTKVVVKEGIEKIAGFSDNSYLYEFEMPDSVKILDGNVFQACISLTKIHFSRNLETIGMNCFHDCKAIKELTLPSSVNEIASPWGAAMNALTKLEVESENTTYDSRDKCNAVIHTSTNKLVCGCLTTIIPNSVEIIGLYAFRLYNLTKMYFPPSVKTIESLAFNGCSLVQYYDFRYHTQIPSLANTNALVGTSTFKIVVSDNLYDTWKSATNWSTYASRIVKASEFVEPTTE